MDKYRIQLLYYKEKDYSKIKELLINSNESWSFNMLGKIYLNKNDIKTAYEYFNKAENITACGYCKFLTGKLDEAMSLISIIKDYSPFTNWLLILINILKDERADNPTYFQIRNFYEQDLELLFKYKQKESIEKIINNNRYFERYNKEIYKYTGRVLMNNNYLETAEKYILKSLDLCYIDPETHYILGEIHLRNGEKAKAIKRFKTACNVVDEYIPAQDRLKDLIN